MSMLAQCGMTNHDAPVKFEQDIAIRLYVRHRAFGHFGVTEPYDLRHSTISASWAPTAASSLSVPPLINLAHVNILGFHPQGFLAY